VLITQPGFKVPKPQAIIISMSVQPPRRFQRGVERFVSPWEPVVSRIFICFPGQTQRPPVSAFFVQTHFETRRA